MEPILHLSLPVCDLRESEAFYVNVLGCELGRVRPDFVDVWFFGMQLTLHARPDEIRTPAENGVRHFGVTLPASRMAALVRRVEAGGAVFASPVTTDYAGTEREQTKTKILDPSGNAIEIKSYTDPSAALQVR